MLPNNLCVGFQRSMNVDCTLGLPIMQRHDAPRRNSDRILV